MMEHKSKLITDQNVEVLQKLLVIYLGLQHCKLYNPQITPDGYFNGTIVDYYDFAYRDYTGNVLEDSLKYMNNWGYLMQERDLLENQFNLYQIREKLW